MEEVAKKIREIKSGMWAEKELPLASMEEYKFRGNPVGPTGELITNITKDKILALFVHGEFKCILRPGEDVTVGTADYSVRSVGNT